MSSWNKLTNEQKKKAYEAYPDHVLPNIETVFIFKSGHREVIKGVAVIYWRKVDGALAEIQYKTMADIDLTYVNIDNLDALFTRATGKKLPTSAPPNDEGLDSNIKKQ